jgi:hypothetical protein
VKKVVGIFTILFAVAFLPAVQAEEKVAIAIIDTGVDTSKVNVFHEVCIMEEKRCPNKQTFMEGPGSATRSAVNGFEHGTRMVRVAQAINPNVNIVFIRIIPADRNDRNPMYAAANSNSTVKQALDWVVANKKKFNIVATSVSFVEYSRFRTGANYCPVNGGLQKTIANLQSLNVGAFFAAGNDYKSNQVGYPACISESIAVGASNADHRVELYSNRSPQIDFFALGTYDILGERIMGTSPSTAALAAHWAKNYKGTYQGTYDYLKSVSINLVVPLAQ